MIPSRTRNRTVRVVALSCFGDSHRLDYENATARNLEIRSKDYHRPGDTADKIDYQKIEKITRTIYMTLWEIANRAARLKVDKPLPAQISLGD